PGRRPGEYRPEALAAVARGDGKQTAPPTRSGARDATDEGGTPAGNGDKEDDVTGPSKSTQRPASSASAWKYLPPPNNEPDPHAEYDARMGFSPEGWPILAARVRGKKHKHEGTHCDDWFEFATAGPWTP